MLEVSTVVENVLIIWEQCIQQIFSDYLCSTRPYARCTINIYPESLGSCEGGRHLDTSCGFQPSYSNLLLFIYLFSFFFFNFYFYFILLYDNVLVLAYIDMNQPRMYMSLNANDPCSAERVLPGG